MATTKKILVVDDDIDLLEQVQAILQADGYEVQAAGGQEEAEEKLLEFIPDIAVIDLMMENMDSGFVLCHNIKKLYPGMVRDSKTFLAEGRKRIGQDVIQRGLNNTTVVPTLHAKLENMAAQRLQESKDRLLQQAFGMWPQVASQYGQQTNPMMGLLGQFGQLGGQLYGDKLYNDRLAALTRPNQPNMSLGQSPLSGFSSSLRLTP